MTRVWPWVPVMAVLAGACTPTHVTLLGAARPRRPDDCLVEMFPTTVPPYAFTPIAKARTECDPVRRNSCVEQLRSEACRLGADAVVGFTESSSEWSSFIDATFVVKGAAPAGPVGSCDPICSPGFACENGQCVSQCNPPCEAGETCNRKRQCESAQPPNQESESPQVVPPQ